MAEVLSDSTRQLDLLYKRDMYEQLGVDFYLIIDPAGETTLLGRVGERYREHDGWKLKLEESCQIELDLSGLFEDL